MSRISKKAKLKPATNTEAKPVKSKLDTYASALKVQNTLIQQGWDLHQQGKLSEAQSIYVQVLKTEPKHFDALQLIGLISVQLGHYEKAIDFLTCATQVNPKHAVCFANLGNTFKLLNRLDQALACYDQAVFIKSDYADAYNNRGNVLKELQRLEDALSSYELAISIRPDYADAYSNRGVVLHALRRHDDALASYAQAISLKPDYAVAYNNRGLVYQENKQLEYALENFNQAISISPQYVDAYRNRGDCLHAMQRFHEACASYKEAIIIDPNNAQTYCNQGNTLLELQLFEQAQACYKKAIELKHDFAQAYNNCGIALKECKQSSEALSFFDNAIAIKSDYTDAYNNRAFILKELKRLDEALACFERAIEINPEYDFLLGRLLYLSLFICKWDDFSNQKYIVREKIKSFKKVSDPFPVLAFDDDVSLHQRCAQIYIKEKHPSQEMLGPIPKRTRKNKIRIGYFSADFYNHPVSILIAELFEIHNKDQFEIYAFSFGKNKQDAMHSRIKKSFDQFIDISDRSDQSVAQLCRELEVDIAVDLGGYTTNSRTGLFSFRAAPLQVNYLGYPGSMGADYIDYIVADGTLIPPRLEQYYSEKIVRLPNTYQVNDRKRVVSEKIFTRHELGLPETGFVFCCFNNNYKITPSTFDSWMRILNAVKGSVLWLLQDNEFAPTNLKKEAEKRGVDPKRLVFAKRLVPAEHLARHHQADLFIDTLPYNAHTTASDALWVGLPVMTLIGESFAGRVAASLLKAIGLPELITTSQSDYEKLAIELASAPHKLQALKKKLAANRLTTPLFDTPLFTKHIEYAYSEMMERYWMGIAPDHIYIED